MDKMLAEAPVKAPGMTTEQAAILTNTAKRATALKRADNHAQQIQVTTEIIDHPERGLIIAIQFSRPIEALHCTTDTARLLALRLRRLANVLEQGTAESRKADEKSDRKKRKQKTSRRSRRRNRR